MYTYVYIRLCVLEGWIGVSGPYQIVDFFIHGGGGVGWLVGFVREQGHLLGNLFTHYTVYDKKNQVSP